VSDDNNAIQRQETTMLKVVEHPTVEQRAARGRAARERVPRSSHAEWSSSQRTKQPLDLLAEQAETRVPELVPIRYGRMAASAFAYYRGAALPMAADLATAPHTGLMAQICGDAHLANFGGFASPERDMFFDVNDFDETFVGPFEWDLKRLAASFEVASRARGLDAKFARSAVLAGMRTYRDAIRQLGGMSNLAVWYERLDMASITARWGSSVSQQVVKQVQANVAKAQAKDQLKARAKLTRMVDGDLRFISEPPLVVPVTELFGEELARGFQKTIHDALRNYRRSLQGDRRHLLESYRFTDLARKVVGVGSVGTRCWVALLIGRDLDDTLILQIKEAEASVLERFLPKMSFSQHGQRVVEGQRLMQAASDIFLGWQRITDGVDGRPHDYYVRQLWDWKLSPNIEGMPPDLLLIYAQLCGWTLALGHARSGDAMAIGAYLGSGDTFPQALATYASAYADQSEADHQTLVDAIAAGKVEAQMGV
jgi:Uncharacterized protein conserved in bacteria (DUF2252)